MPAHRILFDIEIARKLEGLTAFTQTFSTASHTVPATTSLAPPAGGVGAAAGGWDTATNRNLAIASITAIRVDLDSLYKVVTALIDDLQTLKALE